MPLLIGLAILIVLILLLSRCGNDDDSSTPSSGAATTATTATSPTATATATASAAQPATGESGRPGTVTADGSTLLGANDAEPVSDFDGKPVTGTAVKVQSVPADEGFWVGTSTTDRLWVQLTNTHGESDYKVKQGDSIDFTGTAKTADQGFATKVGLTAAEGADQLTQQGGYLAVQSSDVKLFK